MSGYTISTSTGSCTYNYGIGTGINSYSTYATCDNYQKQIEELKTKIDNMTINKELNEYIMKEMEKKDNMKKVVVRFGNNPKEYTYYTNVDMIPGNVYKITNQNNFNYNGASVIVIKYTEEVQIGITLNTIIKAEPVVEPRPDDGIKDVVFNEDKRTTVVLWKDGTKTIIKCQEDDEWDEEKAIALCYMKKHFNNRGCFNEVFKKYCDFYEDEDEYDSYF